MLDDARLRIRAVQDGDVAARPAVRDQRADLFDEPLRLERVARRFLHAHRFALAGIGPQVLAEAAAVVRDQRIRAIEDVALRAVVLLEPDQVADAELALERGHVRDPRAAEGIDALVVVAHGEQHRRFSREQLQPRVLQRVRVLELVDQDVPKPRTVVLAQHLVALEQFVAAQQQFGEIDDPLALALFVVRRIQLDHAPRVVVPGLDLRSAPSFVLGRVDEVLQVLRRELLVVDVQRSQQALDRRELVLRIENLERLRQVRVPVMRPQHPVRQPVERADPHPPRVDREHRAESRQHLARGLVRERDREHALRADLPGRDQPCDARREHARLAAAGAGEHECVLRRQRHGGKLLFVQVGEKPRHALQAASLAKERRCSGPRFNDARSCGCAATRPAGAAKALRGGSRRNG